MTRRFFACTVLLLFCTGCVQFEPEPLDPTAEHDRLAARGRSAATPAPESLLPTNLFPLAGEIDLADGLTLAEANALALFHAPVLVAARSKLRLRGAELLRAGILTNPALFLGPRFSTDGGALILPASMSLEIPLGGRLGSEEDRAMAEIDAARRQLIDGEAKTLVAVRRRFIEIAALTRRRSILQDVLRASEQALELTAQRMRAGQVDRVTLGLATLDRDEAVRDLRTVNVDSVEARVGLLVAIGLLPGQQIEIVADAPLLEPMHLPEPDRAVLLEHPQLQALAARYRAAEHGLEIEVARQYPAIQLGPEYETDDGATSVGFGFSISLPLFDGNAGGVAVAREQRTAGREAWRAAVLELVGAEALARARYTEALSVLGDIRRNTMPAADDAERALELRRSGGETSITETLATRGAIARARLREIDLMREAAIQGLDALWYSGRLFPAAPVQDVNETGEKR